MFPVIVEPVYYPPPAQNTPALYTLPVDQDYECLKYSVLLLFCKYPHSVVHHFEHSLSPSRHLPCLVSNGQALGDKEIILEAFSRLNLNAQLNDYNQSLSQAFASLVESSLCAALDYELCFCHSDLYYEMRSRVYPFPVGLLVSYRELRQKRLLLQSRFSCLSDDDVYDSVTVALGSISTQLGDQPYLFGDKPSHADAYLFAAVYTILNLLSKSRSESKLRAMVLEHSSLVDYSSRIWDEFFVKK